MANVRKYSFRVCLQAAFFGLAALVSVLIGMFVLMFVGFGSFSGLVEMELKFLIPLTPFPLFVALCAKKAYFQRKNWTVELAADYLRTVSAVCIAGIMLTIPFIASMTGMAYLADEPFSEWERWMMILIFLIIPLFHTLILAYLTDVYMALTDHNYRRFSMIANQD